MQTTRRHKSSLLKQTGYGLLVVALLAVSLAAPASADGEPPTAPSDLRGDLDGNNIVLTWRASTDDGTVDGYNIYRDDEYRTTVHTTSFSEPSDGLAHTYYVTAFDNEPRSYSGRSNEWTSNPSPPPTAAAETPEEAATIDPPNEDSSEGLEGSLGVDSPGLSFGAAEVDYVELAPLPNPTGPLAVPRAVTGTATIEGVTLRWFRPNDNRIEGYNIHDGDGAYLATTSDNNPTWSSSDFEHGTFSVSAYGAGLNSARSAAITIAPRQKAIVSIGDSFISGMGSRWRGNSRQIPAETDLGANVYDGEACHQSTEAEVHVSGISGLQTFNVACAGAVTADIGAQAQDAAELAETYDIEMIVVSIGGNDINFAGRLTRCAVRFLSHKRPCYKNWAGRSLPGDIDTTLKPNVARALATIRSTMRAAGMADDSYRLVLQSYPSPLPAGARYSSSRKWRGRGGCPFHSEDMRWAYRTATPLIDDALREVAAASPGVEFLSLKAAFEGKEVCAVGVEHVTTDNLSQAEKHEWVRWGAVDVDYHLIPSAVEQGGSPGEAMHPNAYGQRALGRCLRLVWQAPGHRHHSCTNNGTTPTDMGLQSG